MSDDQTFSYIVVLPKRRPRPSGGIFLALVVAAPIGLAIWLALIAVATILWQRLT